MARLFQERWTTRFERAQKYAEAALGGSTQTEDAGEEDLLHERKIPALRW